MASTSRLRASDHFRTRACKDGERRSSRKVSPRSGTLPTRASRRAAVANSHSWTFASGLANGSNPKSTASAKLWSPVTMTPDGSHCARKLRISRRGTDSAARYTGRLGSKTSTLPEGPTNSKAVMRTTLKPDHASTSAFGATMTSGTGTASPERSLVKMCINSSESCPATRAATSDSTFRVTSTSCVGSLRMPIKLLPSNSPEVFARPVANSPVADTGMSFTTSGGPPPSLPPLPLLSPPFASRKAWTWAESFRP
mmetsp:Transcript_131712/g.421555  ORF Transcript_131712/g.421555 Transcript_131712/m.421555 type:complete len:255 (-) Transcript_131712:855-1619(-)